MGVFPYKGSFALSISFFKSTCLSNSSTNYLGVNPLYRFSSSLGGYISDLVASESLLFYPILLKKLKSALELSFLLIAMV